MIRPSVLIFLALVLQLGASVEDCDDSSIGNTLPDPEDCHGYFLCHSGHKLQQYCAPGMKYKEDMGLCVVGKCPPCNCENIPTTTPTEPTTESSSESSSSSSTSESTESSTDSSSTESTPSATESSSESSSTSESTESSTSSSSTESSSDSSTLDPTTTQQPTESSTDSSTSPPPTDPSTESSTSDSTASSESSPQSPTPTEEPTSTPTTSNPGSPVSCENVRDGSFFSDPTHCQNYYVCRNGHPVLLHCQKGMWFDDTNFVCNFPHLVDCPANID